MSRKSTIWAIAALCGVSLVAAAAVAFILRGGDHKPMTVVAQFEDSVGLYEGNAVSVLGMRVGEVTKIVP